MIAFTYCLNKSNQVRREKSTANVGYANAGGPSKRSARQRIRTARTITAITTPAAMQNSQSGKYAPTTGTEGGAVHPATNPNARSIVKR